MRPSKVDGPVTSQLAACCGVWLVSFLAIPAIGHPMTVTRGRAVVAGDALTLSLETPAEDLLHTQKLSPNAEGLYAVEAVRRAAETYGQALGQRIVIRDAHGEEIDGWLESCKLDHDVDRGLSLGDLRRSHVRYSFKFALGRANEYLSFQQVARGADVVLPSTIVLSVRSGDVKLRTVRLTRGGNVEVVRLASEKVGRAAQESGCRIAGRPACRRFAQSESQRTIRAIVHIHDAGVRLDVFMPVRILETWIPLPRSRRDFLEGDEQTRCHRQLARFIARHNPMSIDGHRVEARRTGDLIDIEFLDVGEFGGDPGRTPRRLSVWTSRVRFTMQYDSPSHPRSVDLQWTLFNASVLASHALIVVEGDCFERDLSTYDPHLRWTAD